MYNQPTNQPPMVFCIYFVHLFTEVKLMWLYNMYYIHLIITLIISYIF
jgi:hypothetical protein